MKNFKNILSENRKKLKKQFLTLEKSILMNLKTDLQRLITKKRYGQLLVSLEQSIRA